MNRTTIKKALRRSADGAEFVTKGDIKKCLGCGNDRAAEIVSGLHFIKIGNWKRYDADEVAERIYQSVQS